MSAHEPARRPPRPRLSVPLLAALVLWGTDAPAEAAAQATTERTPNLSGGWVGAPGTLHFNFLHRFWITEAGRDDKLVNSPSMLLAYPLHERVLLGVQYATNSLVIPNRFNEWEAFARWAPLKEEEAPLGLAVAAGYNSAAKSADGELTASFPLGDVRLLGAGRAFSDARGTGEAGMAALGGVVYQATPGLTVGGDLGALWIDGDAERVWGAGLQLRIPATPHTLSIQATNTRTGTLQGSSSRTRTVWGFEFTIPMVLARYLRRTGAAVPAGDAPQVRDGVVEITMTDDMQFRPDSLEIQVGDTVVWRNPTVLPHTVTAHPERVRDAEQVELPEGAEPFDSGNMFEGDEFRHVFTVPGRYRYVCVPHDMVGMLGTIVVRPE